MMALKAADVPDWLAVSGETVDRLQQFAALVIKWNSAVNLVSKSSIPSLWARHLLDSAQVFRLAPPQAKRWLDLGSGGGFPGIVIAILAAELLPSLRVTLVESDQRKSVFLSESIRQLDLSVDVKACRIEILQPQLADVMTARALAPLTELCGYARTHLAPGGAALFQKGASVEAEIAAAQAAWRFDLVRHPSLTDPAAVILDIRAIADV